MEEAESSVNAARVPRHVAIIMDGNGRWARARGLPRVEGHRRGMSAVREAIDGCLEAGVQVLTLFAFSTQNWQRPPAEIRALMGLLRVYADKEARELDRRGVEVRVLGWLDEIDPATRDAILRLEEGTRGGERMRLNLMISYSGREELVRAMRTLAERVRSGELEPAGIGAEEIESALTTAGLPDPDLLIRTSGEQRISNFLLWQLAWTEIHTCRVLWPEFDRSHLEIALRDYAGRDRRFGRVAAR